MKKFIILLFFALISYNAYAKKFNFDLIGGLKLGMTKESVMSLLDKKGIKFEISNNTSGGKFITFIPNFSLFELEITEVRLVLVNNKVNMIVFMMSASDVATACELLDGMSNCSFFLENIETFIFIFDNCGIAAKIVDGILVIAKNSDLNLKCKN